MTLAEGPGCPSTSRGTSGTRTPSPHQTLLSDRWLSTVSVAQIQEPSLSRVGRAPSGTAASPGGTQLPPPLPRELLRVRALLVRGDGAVTSGRPAHPRGPGAPAGGSSSSTGHGPSGGGTGPGAAGSGRSRTSSGHARRRGLEGGKEGEDGVVSGVTGVGWERWCVVGRDKDGRHRTQSPPSPGHQHPERF